jgi:membrane protein DedA with SNARE-associated domain
MSAPTRFGLWTLFAAICWIAGLITAGVVIWHMWKTWWPG